MNCLFEKKLFQKGWKNIIGLDEAGRGPLAGPVYAASVLLTKKDIKKLKKYKNFIKKIKDSKKMSPFTRQELFSFLKKEKILKFHCSYASEKIIDKINIENATKKAMERCLKKFKIPEKDYKKTIILIDGNRILNKNLKIKQVPIVKGDNKIFVIALSSIIAKFQRDEKMKKLSKKYPLYKFEIHKGYPTKTHKKLLKKFGPCEIHRKSFLKNILLKK